MGFRTALLIVGIFASLPFAAASSHVETADVAGRTILFDLTKFDPNLAAVAGYAAQSSTWLDGSIVMERANQGHVYATATGTGDPTKKNLFPTGYWYNFTDDNGATWNVQEWYYLHIEEYQYMLAGQSAVERLAFRNYVWSVESIGDPITDLAHNVDYNFVIVVDVTKLDPEPADPETGAALRKANDEAEGHGIPLNIADSDIPEGGSIDIHFSRVAPVERCSICHAKQATYGTLIDTRAQ